MPDNLPAGRPRIGAKRLLAAAFLLLLAASHATRCSRGSPGPAPDESSIEVGAIDGDVRGRGQVRLAFRDSGDPGTGRLPVLLLHGSPGRNEDFEGLTRTLAPQRRVVAPDLPGFGGSTRDIPDYSIRAHARYTLDLLDELGIEQAHVVGFSMGGGVALNLYDLAPERVRSVTLLSATAVQELELFGDYRLNHAAHTAQVGLLWALREGLPHFGLLDGVMLDVSYARNFRDSDQRPLRDVLLRFEPPLLVLHGRDDFLVPPEAAVEHHRIVPHSELQMLDASHFMVFVDPASTARRIEEFIERADAGQAPRRADAAPERVARAAEPYDPSTAPPFVGFALALAVLGIAAATLFSEDLACIGVGLLVAQGRIEFWPGVAGCFIGIFVGDLLLYLAGRIIGRPALGRAPMRWILGTDQVDAASRWFTRRGPVVILISRFVPGLRTPTYFAAGTLHTGFWSFAFYFAVAVAIWTPLLVWISMRFGAEVFGWVGWFQRHPLWAMLLLAIWILVLVRVIGPLFNWRGRRRLVAKWKRAVNWEFWPPWMFYPPVVAWVLWLGLRYRGPLVFTAANPAMPAGGFIAESKMAILEGLAGAGERVARTAFLPAALPPAERLAAARAFLDREGLALPVVLKPDAGQRGSGVAVVRDETALAAYLERAAVDTLIQEYVPGLEFGIFYYRHPGAERGQVFSITEKRMPVVVGDGHSTLERLIYHDRRAVCMARHYLAVQQEPLRVPGAGEPVTLVELGTHCRGAVFLDGSRLLTSRLVAVIDTISRGYDGFFFGRYDVRTPDPEAFGRGEFKIIELNGVTSEATHVYDPQVGLSGAWRTLCRQWSIAFEIGAANRERGVAPARLGELIGLLRTYRRASASH